MYVRSLNAVQSTTSVHRKAKGRGSGGMPPEITCLQSDPGGSFTYKKQVISIYQSSFEF